MPPRRKAAGDAEARVKKIASKEAAIRAESAAAQALRAAQNPAALAPPPPPPPSQTATKPKLIEQVMQKNRAAPANAKTPQNRTVAGRVQKSKKESPASSFSGQSLVGPGNNIQPLVRQSGSQQTSQTQSPLTSSASKAQIIRRPSVSQQSSQGDSFQSSATSTSKPQSVRRPSVAQETPQNGPSQPASTTSSGQQTNRRPSTSQNVPQDGSVQPPRTPRLNGHPSLNHPTFSSPGKQTAFHNPYIQQDGMPTSPVSPSMRPSQSMSRRSSSSMLDQAMGQWSALPPQLSMGQAPHMGYSPNVAQLQRRQSFGVVSDDGSGQGYLQQGMQSPHNMWYSSNSQGNGHGMQNFRDQSAHADEVLRRRLFGVDSNDRSSRGQPGQMMAPQSPHMRRDSQNSDHSIEAGHSQPRRPSFHPIQQGQGQQFHGFQGQQQYLEPNQNQVMQLSPQQMATMSYQSQMQRILNHNQQLQRQYPNPNDSMVQGNQARYSPMMPPPIASNQIAPVSGGPGRLKNNDTARLVNMQGKEQKGSASTQACPDRLDDSLDGHPPSQTRPTINPQASPVNRRASASSLPSERPVMSRTTSSLSRIMIAAQDNEDLDMGGEILENVKTAQQPTAISTATKSVKSSPDKKPIVSEINPSGRKQAPKKFTKKESTKVVNKKSKGGQVKETSPDADANSSPSTTMRATVPPTPKTWTNLPPPLFQPSSSPPSLPPQLGAAQTDIINEVDTLLVSSLIKGKKGGDLESELDAEEHLPSSPPPRLAENNGEFDILIQDAIDALLIPHDQAPAAGASPQKSSALLSLEQHHEDRLAFEPDFSQEDIRRTGVAAKILASIASSMNRSTPQPPNAQARYTIPVEFKDLAIGQLKRAREYPGDHSAVCTFCQYEEDWGIGPGEFLLPREAFAIYCADCLLSQTHFLEEYRETTKLKYPENVMTVGRWNELDDRLRKNPTLKEAIDSTGGKQATETYWKAKKLPQNTISVHDGKDISRFRGTLTCRGSPYGQVDITKPQICRKCIGEKFDIVKHLKHIHFTSILNEPRTNTRTRRCMVCSNQAVCKCAQCPLRLCGGCFTLLRRCCKFSCIDANRILANF